MDKTTKFLKKLSHQERYKIREIISNILDGNIKNFNVKKLRGRDNTFRVRSGNIRVVFKTKNSIISLIFVGRKNDTIYKKLN